MSESYLDRLFNLKNKIVLVTGATGQLGSAICKAYLAAGARIVGTDKDLNPRKVVKNKNARYLELDVTRKDAVEDIFGRIDKEIGHVDILVNNAGVNVFTSFENRTEEEWDWVSDVNLKGTFFCLQAYVDKAKKKRKGGNIINVASLYGVVSPDFRIYTDCARHNPEVYGAVKAGVIQMTKYFAVHLAKYKIRVNCVSPGGIFNPQSPQGKDFIKNYSYRCPTGRMADTDEIVGGVLYLSSDAASYTTGVNLMIDGGISCW